MTNSNMTCEAFDSALPDYLEGTLDDARRVSVEGHLSECVRCAGLLRDIENIREEAGALPDLVPSRDLWQGIEARIAAPIIPLAARPERQRRIAPAWLGIAAAALIVSTAGITYTLTARSLPRPAPTGAVAMATPANNQAQPSDGSDSGTAQSVSSPAPTAIAATNRPQRAGTSLPARPDVATGRPALPATLVSSDQAHSEVVYGKEIEMLERIVSQRETQLDSSTVAIIRKNLRIIDAAIEQSRAALVRDPASQMLGQQLTHALDKKVELLRTAALLPAST
jgi:anti-sigma factor RsiW